VNGSVKDYLDDLERRIAAATEELRRLRSVRSSTLAALKRKDRVQRASAVSFLAEVPDAAT
jgi:hypothetical protein